MICTRLPATLTKSVALQVDSQPEPLESRYQLD